MSKISKIIEQFYSEAKYGDPVEYRVQYEYMDNKGKMVDGEKTVVAKDNVYAEQEFTSQMKKVGIDFEITDVRYVGDNHELKVVDTVHTKSNTKFKKQQEK